jgi:hypothetical protein
MPSRNQEIRAVVALLSEMSGDTDGEFSPSIYETARLVRYTPSLRGHVQRVRFLVDAQHADGSWGGPDGYGLVPTLSATEALLTVGRRLPDGGMRTEVIRAADRGLRALFARLNAGEPPPLPDTVAVELIVPGLIAAINAQLDLLEREPLAGLGGRQPGLRLLPPDGMNDALLTRLREAVVGGQPLPTKLLHSLEVLGSAARRVASVPLVGGGVGCSPAATAVWLGDDAVRAGWHPAARYLEAAQRRGRGPVPVATPLVEFERAWVLSTVTEAGLADAVSSDLVRSLHAAFGPLGVAGGSGLPPDADDTATALNALARLGSPRSPKSLWSYQQGAHFACFPGERTPSTSTNAHVLQAFGACLTPDLQGRDRYRVAMAALTAWLCEQQEADGSWRDKWHASPYYATRCCAVALAEYGSGAARAAVRRAVEWVLDTQRRDGSWGRWAGTYEETAYAVQILLRTGMSHSDAVIERVARGCAVLLNTADGGEYPPLWHDKDLYTPGRIVRAEGIAALHRARANQRVAALIGRPAAKSSCGAGNQP